MLQSFAPIADENTKILIIGTMPSAASLAVGEYYAHSRNIFWRLMTDIFNSGQYTINFSVKTQRLLCRHIGLWDALKSCERQTSSDNDIYSEQPNDFRAFLASHPNIKTLLFNGQKAFLFFKKYHHDLLADINCVVLPSTSPANARLTYQQKLAIWRRVLLPRK